MYDEIVKIIEKEWEPEFCIQSEIKSIDVTRMYNWVKSRAMRGLGYTCYCRLTYDQKQAINLSTAYMLMLANGYDTEVDRQRVEKDTLDFMQTHGLLNTRFR